LLEEHHDHSDHCPPADTGLEHVQPRRHFELEFLREALADLIRMARDKDLAIVARLGTDVEPLCLDTGVCHWEAPEAAEGVQSFFIATLSGEPARREGQEVECDREAECCVSVWFYGSCSPGVI
jgi:hypothetical protein